MIHKVTLSQLDVGSTIAPWRF